MRKTVAFIVSIWLLSSVICAENELLTITVDRLQGKETIKVINSKYVVGLEILYVTPNSSRNVVTLPGYNLFQINSDGRSAIFISINDIYSYKQFLILDAVEGTLTTLGFFQYSDIVYLEGQDLMVSDKSIGDIGPNHIPIIKVFSLKSKDVVATINCLSFIKSKISVADTDYFCLILYEDSGNRVKVYFDHISEDGPLSFYAYLVFGENGEYSWQ